MIAGIDFPDKFSNQKTDDSRYGTNQGGDNIAQRRANSGAGNPHDPESLLTGREVELGLNIRQL